MSDPSLVIATIERAKRERWTTLNLSFLKLTELPETVGDLVDLTSLNLKHNRLVSLPASLSELPNLCHVDVSGNYLDNVALETIFAIENLQTLNLADNSLEILSESIGKPIELNWFNIYGNHLQTLPASLERLTKLTAIDLGCNKITNLPDRFRFPPHLKRLCLGDNKLSQLGECFQYLNDLHAIDLSDNPLTDLSLLQTLPYLETVLMFEVELPRRYWLKFSDWHPQWLLDETNAEIRRVLISGVGYERIYRELGAIEIDRWREYELLEIAGSVDIEPILLLKMICPSTGHIHVLRVPPTMTTAEAAITWVNHGIHPDEIAIQT